MNAIHSAHFDIAGFLADAGLGRKIIRLKAGQPFFAQGDEAHFVFYLQAGSAKLTVIPKRGKEAEMFLKFVLLRGIRTQEDLVDQLFNSSEKRLARTLLLMAEFGKPGEPEMLIPPITQQALAEMIGTTRSRVSYFMNRFRELGYIEYNGRIHVNKSLLNVVLHDQLPEQSSSRPTILDPPRNSSRRAMRNGVVSKVEQR